MGLRITTWNVNGIRNPFGYQPWRDSRTFDAMFDILEADVVVLQELKIQRKDLRDDMVLVPGWDCFFSLPKHKKGYSGVGIYTRQSVCAPIRAEEGLLGVLCPPDFSTPYRELPNDQCIGGYPTEDQVTRLGVDPVMLDAEGRCVVLEFPAFVLFGVYSPANSNGLRDDFRYGFLCALDTRIRNLCALGKRVVLTGDLNVSREEIDTANAEESMRKEGLTHDEYISTPNRRIFNQLLEGGQVVGKRDEGREKPILWDICRGFHEDRKGMYTHWEQKINARPGNFGSRIDYVLCSIDMKSWFTEANIQEGLMGSDHCPVYAVTSDIVAINGIDVNIRDIMNPPGMFENGVRQREYSIKDTPALSGRLMPEFNKRRNIRDMFVRKPLPGAATSLIESDPAHAKFANGSSNLVDEIKPSMLQVQHDTPTARTSTDRAVPTTFSAQATDINKKKRAVNSDISQSVKRGRLDSASTSSSLGKGQSSLKGFFKPVSSVSSSRDALLTHSVGPDLPFVQPNESSPTSPHAGATYESVPEQPTGTVTRPSVSGSPKSNPQISSIVLEEASATTNPIAARETWTKLFSKPVAPRCEGHNEPCISLVTKKSGFNCGRAFWICPRPVGPTGNKEKGTQWRCPTFVWASDWNGSA